MDEEDSQDERINRNISHGKGKRPAMSIISDDGKKLYKYCSVSCTDRLNCRYYFCFSANSCPVDRIVFNGILLRKCYGGKVQKTIPVKKPVKPTEEQVEVDLDQTSCEVCGGRDREDRLLLCDGCDDGYHMECLTPPLDAVPVEEWFCPMCIAHNRTSGHLSFLKTIHYINGAFKTCWVLC
uniref:PHD and ring finger domains 1 n=1 Tax=Cyprinus carpio TaxID=7962 RepID=A0A8C2G3H0_CYPCA